jgi:hypothetical protein
MLYYNRGWVEQCVENENSQGKEIKIGLVPILKYSKFTGRHFHGRCYFAGLKVTKRNQATVLLTLTLFQTPTLILTPTLFLT